MRDLQAQIEEIRLLRQLLEKNAARLAPAFVEKAERGLPEGFKVSTIRPVTTRSAPKSEEELEQDNATCAACGKAKAKKVCSRCKETHYCSREYVFSLINAAQILFLFTFISPFPVAHQRCSICFAPTNQQQVPVGALEAAQEGLQEYSAATEAEGR